MKEKQYNSLSIAAFVMGFIMPPIGIILGIIALVQIKKTKEKGIFFAIFPMITFGLFIFLAIIFSAIGFFAINTYNSENFQDYQNQDQITENICDDIITWSTECIKSEMETEECGFFIIDQIKLKYGLSTEEISAAYTECDFYS